MDKSCIKCGADISPLTGSLEASQIKIEKLRKWDIDVPSVICTQCFNEYVKIGQARYGDDFFYENHPSQEFLDKIKAEINSINIYTFNPYDKIAYKNLGLISAFVALGTGPITSLVSSFNDALGQDSEIYNQKLREAEEACINKLKVNAHTKGASAVIGLQVTFTELTDAHGIILVAMVGTAIADS